MNTWIVLLSVLVSLTATAPFIFSHRIPAKKDNQIEIMVKFGGGKASSSEEGQQSDLASSSSSEENVQSSSESSWSSSEKSSGLSLFSEESSESSSNEGSFSESGAEEKQSESNSEGSDVEATENNAAVPEEQQAKKEELASLIGEMLENKAKEKAAETPAEETQIEPAPKQDFPYTDEGNPKQM